MPRVEDVNKASNSVLNVFCALQWNSQVFAETDCRNFASARDLLIVSSRAVIVKTKLFEACVEDDFARKLQNSPFILFRMRFKRLKQFSGIFTFFVQFSHMFFMRVSQFHFIRKTDLTSYITQDRLHLHYSAKESCSNYGYYSTYNK